jgi:hypothetical protein
VPPASLPRMVKLLAGRMPDQSDPHEGLASYTLAQGNGAHLGSVFRILVLTPAQAQSKPAQVKVTPGQ